MIRGLEQFISTSPGLSAMWTICRSLSAVEGDGVVLLHCDRDWTILGTEGRASSQQAKTSAEEIYAGVSSLWVDAQVSEKEAARHLDEIWSKQRCNFCGKTPLDLADPGRMVEKNGSWICEPCVKVCYEMFQQDHKGT